MSNQSTTALDGKLALVTDDGSGIGQRDATQFAKAGADLILMGRTFSKIEDIARHVHAIGTKTSRIACDVWLARPWQRAPACPDLLPFRQML